MISPWHANLLSKVLMASRDKWVKNEINWRKQPDKNCDILKPENYFFHLAASRPKPQKLCSHNFAKMFLKEKEIQ